MKSFKINRMKDLQNTDQILNSQLKRIEELKKENAELKKLLDDYRNKEKEIAMTLKIAKNQAENIIGEAKVKYALECERLKIFSEKWTSLFNKSPEKILESINKTDEMLRKCHFEIENMLIDSFGKNMESYKTERDRLKKEPQLNYNEIIQNEIDKTIEEMPIKDLEELLNQL